MNKHPSELPNSAPDATRDVVTYIPPKHVDLREHGFSRKQAQELRASLAAFAEDWNSPEMDVYDNYDAAKARL